MTCFRLAMVLLLVACSADGGWRYDEFEGPGFTTVGGLHAKYTEDDTFIVAGTWLHVSKSGRALFTERIDAIKRELWADPVGLVGYAFASGAGGEHRTVSVWENRDAMYAFVLGEAHTAALTAHSEISEPEDPGRTTSWEVTGAELPPPWSVVVDKVDHPENTTEY